MITAETVNQILHFKGDGLPVVSLYARVTTDPRSRVAAVRSHIDSQLHHLRTISEDHRLSHRAKMSIRGDVDRIIEVVGQQQWPPGAVALFSCTGRQFFEQVSLPREVRDRVVVDETAWVRPMLAVLDESHRCCVVVVDRETARLWELFGDEMREIDTLSLSADSARNQSKMEELTKRHFRQVTTLVDKLFRDSGFDLLVVGGHRTEVPHFLEFLTHEVRSRLAGCLPVDDDARSSFGEIKRQAIMIVDRYERDEEQRMVAEVMEASATGGLAALGLSPCLWAASVAAVDRLLVQDGVIQPGVMCDRDRLLALSGETCQLCGLPTRHVPDVVDELVQIVIDESASVEHVSADTALKEHVVAASLRFALPPQP